MAVVAAAAAALLLSTEAGSRLMLTGLLDRSPPPSADQARRAQAIVVAGGNRDRVHEAARLHALTGLPILLAGKGTGDSPYEAESEKMAWILRTQHGIEPRWVETRSVNTYENAVESWCLLEGEGVRRIVLVTHARHMARARHAFRSAGFVVLPDPIPEPRQRALEAADFVPSRTGLQRAGRVLGEYVELVVALLEDLVSGAPRCGAGAAPD